MNAGVSFHQQQQHIRPLERLLCDINHVAVQQGAGLMDARGIQKNHLPLGQVADAH